MPVMCQVAKAKENGREIDRDTAFEEVVADSMETMLTQGDIGDFMAQLKQKDKTLRDKIREWFRNLADSLKAVADEYRDAKPESPEGRLVAQMDDFVQVLQQAYAEALVEAGENYRANEGNKKTTREGGVKYSFASQVDSVKSNTHDPNNHLNMGSVPLSLSRILSIPRLPMLITPNHVYSISVSVNQAKTEKRYRKGVNYHDLGWTVTKKLPNLVGKPEMIIKSNTDVADAAFVVVTSETDKNGDPVIVAFKSDGHGNYFNLDFPTVAVLSGYGKHNFQNYLAKAKTENRILFVNKKSQKKQNTTGVQFSDNIRSSDYTKNLSQFQAIVNSKYKGTAFEKTPILLSDRDAGAEKVAAALERQNAKLKRDVKDLRELLSLQGKLTHGSEFTKSSIEEAMRSLIKAAGSKLNADDRQKMAGMLKDLYRYIAGDKELTWDGVEERAGAIADLLMNNVNIKAQRDAFSEEVLRALRGSKIQLSDSQRAEVEKLYGYENYRKMLFGAGVRISRSGFFHRQRKWPATGYPWPVFVITWKRSSCPRQSSFLQRASCSRRSSLRQASRPWEPQASAAWEASFLSAPLRCGRGGRAPHIPGPRRAW